jgi:hypothetical protein
MRLGIMLACLGRPEAPARFVVRQSRLPSTCALLEIFDGPFGRRVEAAGNIAGRKCPGHYKYALKSSHVVASRTDAECWTAIHKLYASLAISGNLSPGLATKISYFRQSLGHKTVTSHGGNQFDR